MAVNRPYAVNGLNQYSSAGASTFGYDPNGNLIAATQPPYTSNYVYDVENRLVSASGAQTAFLVYDPLGRLFQVSGWASGATQFLYDDDALIAEYNSAGTMVHRYIHGALKGVDDPLIWYHNQASGWRRPLVADQQGSIVAVADMYGNPVAINAYDEYGIPKFGNVGRFQYTGQAWIPELGMYHYKSRLYSPTLGRFLQVDMIGYKDQINLYAYVGDDPVNKTDPDGKELVVKGSDEFRKTVKEQIRQLQNRPAGNSLVRQLINSKNVHRIVESRSKFGNKTIPQGPSRNGKGDGSLIHFNPNSSETMMPDDHGNLNTPAPVQLGHELGHADAMDRGVQSEQMNPSKAGTTPPAERQAMWWEHRIRQEHGLAPRSHYYQDPNQQ